MLCGTFWKNNLKTQSMHSTVEAAVSCSSGHSRLSDHSDFLPIIQSSHRCGNWTESPHRSCFFSIYPLTAEKTTLWHYMCSTHHTALEMCLYIVTIQRLKHTLHKVIRVAKTAEMLTQKKVCVIKHSCRHSSELHLGSINLQALSFEPH